MSEVFSKRGYPEPEFSGVRKHTYPCRAKKSLQDATRAMHLNGLELFCAYSCISRLYDIIHLLFTRKFTDINEKVFFC